MARRQHTGRREQLDEAELATLRERLNRMPEHELEAFYKATRACQLPSIYLRRD